MIGRASFRYVLRSLTRHGRRTVLSILGMAVGCTIALLVTSFTKGSEEMFVRAAAESGSGHLCAVSSEWLLKRGFSARLKDWKKELVAARAVPGVKVATPRARAEGLLAFGNRTVGTEIIGVDPSTERLLSRLIRNVPAGRYLQPGDTGSMVVGEAILERLDVELDDDLYVTVVGREDVQSGMFRIVGVIRTGSSDLDVRVCHVMLEDLEALTGYHGAAEIAVLLEDRELSGDVRTTLRQAMPEGDQVVTWKDLNPQLAATMESDAVSQQLVVWIIVAIAVVGIASAQLAGVLERRQEFAVLTALGMKGHQVVALIMLDAVLLGLAGAALALAIATPVTYLFATRGISVSVFIGESRTLAGNVLIDPVVYGDFGTWLVWYAVGISVVATVGASLYPAWFAAKTDPASALRAV